MSSSKGQTIEMSLDPSPSLIRQLCPITFVSVTPIWASPAGRIFWLFHAGELFAFSFLSDSDDGLSDSRQEAHQGVCAFRLTTIRRGSSN
jgi:hypothetical protein